MTFLLERSVTATTTWPSVSPTFPLSSSCGPDDMQSLVNEDITVELPCLQSSFDSASGVLGGSQNFQ